MKISRIQWWKNTRYCIPCFLYIYIYVYIYICTQLDPSFSEPQVRGAAFLFRQKPLLRGRTKIEEFSWRTILESKLPWTEVDPSILDWTPLEKICCRNINHRVWLNKSSKRLHQQRGWDLNSYFMKPCNFIWNLGNFWLKDTPKNQHQSSLFPSSFPFQFPRRRGVFRPRLELSKAAGLMKQLKSLKRSRCLAEN